MRRCVLPALLQPLEGEGSCMPYCAKAVEAARWMYVHQPQGYLMLTLAQVKVKHKGVERVQRCRQYAHAFVWEMVHGPQPAGALVLRHVCNNTACLNPLHIVRGTRQENVADGKNTPKVSAKKKARFM